MSKIPELVLAFLAYIHPDDDDALLERLSAPDIGKLVDIQAAAAFDIRRGRHPSFIQNYKDLPLSAIVQDVLRTTGSELATPEHLLEIDEVRDAIRNSEAPWLMINQVRKSQRFLADSGIRTEADARIPEILVTLQSFGPPYLEPPYLERGIMELIVDSDYLMNRVDIKEKLKGLWSDIQFWEAYSLRDVGSLHEIFRNLKRKIFGDIAYSDREVEEDVERALESVEYALERFFPSPDSDDDW